MIQILERYNSSFNDETDSMDWVHYEDAEKEIEGYVLIPTEYDEKEIFDYISSFLINHTLINISDMSQELFGLIEHCYQSENDMWFEDADNTMEIKADEYVARLRALIDETEKLEVFKDRIEICEEITESTDYYIVVFASAIEVVNWKDYGK